MPHLLIAGRLDEAGHALLRAAPDVTVDYVESTDPGAFVPFMPRAEGLVIRTQPLTAEIIAQAPLLRVVSRHGVGYDSVDVAALTARGVPLAVCGDVNSTAVAEHAMALILALAKELRPMDAAVRGGAWGRRGGYGGRELGGKRLLVVGYGRSGRKLARLGAAFGMEVAAFDPYLAEAAMAGEPARRAADLGAALAEADVVSLHLPKADRPVLGAAEVARMKPGAILVNTARGGVADEAAVAAALAEGRLAGAGFDVFDPEPPTSLPLAAAENAILTPHVAGLTPEGMARMAEGSVRNVLDFFAGRLDPGLVVNRAALGLPA